MTVQLRKSTLKKSKQSKRFDTLRKRAARVAKYGIATKAQARYQKREPQKSRDLVSFKIPKKLRHITNANRKNSPLLRLPAEIRNQIFAMAVYSEMGNLVEVPGKGGVVLIDEWVREMLDSGNYSPDFKWVEKYWTPSYIVKRMALGLPATCRQIYSETAVLAYGVNTFVVAHHKALKEWLLLRTPAQRDVIENVWIIDEGRFKVERNAELDDQWKTDVKTYDSYYDAATDERIIVKRKEFMNNK
ncbi:hypothetical protein IQ07DRAFT_639731 [Pyrenochaeta sp. DS3sAY3a]|nr:hypothetical protein IQ07DRAFT_639731 [Pyrenochaeta sp. DS3sAY3a]